METQKFLPKNQKTDFTKELSVTSGKMLACSIETTIKKCDLKDLKSKCFSSEIEYYMNAKDVIWVVWRYHKKNYAKRFPSCVQLFCLYLDRYITICENSKKKWKNNMELITHFERFYNLNSV